MRTGVFFIFLIGFLYSCIPGQEKSYSYTFMTLSPAHFHAGLVQKSMYEDISPEVYVYAEAGADLDRHLALVQSYNERESDPTSWNEHIYTGEDFREAIWREKPGNVLVLSGNNAEKFQFIDRAVQEGVNVFADKPMIIKYEDYDNLVDALDESLDKGLMVYDIMTERYEITTRLQRLLAADSALTGGLIEGSIKQPTIEKRSVHYLSKIVSGKQLVRPEWFLDVSQQGRPVADVGTHLVDLILWTLHGENEIDASRVEILDASEWATRLDHRQYEKITGQNEYADFLLLSMNADSVLQLPLNGDCVFKVDDYHAKYSVEWGYEAEEGGDTHYSIIRGRKVDLEILQGAEEGFIPQLYIVNLQESSDVKQRVEKLQSELQTEFPGVNFAYQEDKNRWKLNIPDPLRIGHEAHFAEVTEKYLTYLKSGVMPKWEIDFMKTKYYVTTMADLNAKTSE